ncbi:uncharacterized protein LOC122229325 [Panthera leo]|uniref:uncharacterized protein LOC122229325 n=1 Tax=Panthera leo TaxID=9689 RepID=UPI001C69DACE|nr:uncharacterized protein LOC122229325 [Panthera leo]
MPRVVTHTEDLPSQWPSVHLCDGKLKHSCCHTSYTTICRLSPLCASFTQYGLCRKLPGARAQGEHAHHAEAGNEPETGSVPCVVSWRRQCGPEPLCLLLLRSQGHRRRAGGPRPSLRTRPSSVGRLPAVRGHQTAKQVFAQQPEQHLRIAGRAPGLWSVRCGRPHIPEESWPRRHQGMPATWAEPQGPVLNSEGSLSFLRLNFIMKGVLGHNSLTSKF